jgi:hypothetical protein
MTLNDQLQVQAVEFAHQHYTDPDAADVAMCLSAMCAGAELALKYCGKEPLKKTEIKAEIVPPGTNVVPARFGPGDQYE